MDINIYSFFSGAGFLDLGFEKEGYNIVYVNEYSKSFLDAYKYARKQMNIAPPKHGYYCGDINDLLKGKLKKNLFEYISDEKKKDLVGFIGGPPCPDFSVAGKNEGITGSHGKLTTSYKRAILLYEPDFFVFENVKGLWSTKKHKEEYKKIKKSLSAKGYILIDKLVNALEYGVPQERERVILFGIKYELISSDRTQARSILLNNFSWGNNAQLTLDAIAHCDWPTAEAFVEDSKIDIPQNVIKELTVEHWFVQNDVYNHPNSRNYFVPHSQTRFDTILEGDVSRKSFKRLHRWRYSPTAAYGNNEVHLHPYKKRRISVAEALAIQSLPKEYALPQSMTKSEMFKTVGNGVPYLLSKGIASGIKHFLLNEIERKEN